jgi:nitrogen-specific signal transduction histidine kinase
LTLFYFLSVLAIIILVLDRARGEVASLKEFNEHLVDGLGEGLQVVDGEFIIRHANRWMSEQVGPMVGRRCYEVLTANQQPCPGCPLAQREAMLGPARLDISGPNERRFLLTCSPVRQADAEIFLLELVGDITEQERLRQRLSEVEQLAAVGELAAGVAHEIRNPLAAILNAATLLEEEAL